MDWNKEPSVDSVDSKPVFYTRIGLQTYATMVKYFEENDIQFSSKSGIVRRTVEMMAVALEQSGAISSFDTVSDALSFLESRGLAPNDSERSEKGVKRALEEEDRLLESVGHDAVSNEDVKKWQKRIEKRREEMEEEEQSQPEPWEEEEENPAVDSSMIDQLKDHPGRVSEDESEDDEAA